MRHAALLRQGGFVLLLALRKALASTRLRLKAHVHEADAEALLAFRRGGG